MKFHGTTLICAALLLAACGKGDPEPTEQPPAPEASTPDDPAEDEPAEDEPASRDDPTDDAPAEGDDATTDDPPTDAPGATEEAEGDDTSGLVTEEVTYEGGGVTMKGYLAWDPAIAGPRPGVLVVHEWWGHNDYVRERARKLAELGYTALAVDMYGDGKTAEHPKDAMQFSKEATEDAEATLARFSAARTLLAEHDEADGDEIAAIGYCFGGAVVLNAARAGLDLAGVVSFHGSLDAYVEAEPGTIEAPILVLNGADDPMVPPAKVEAFEREMAEARATFDVVNYEGATHAFTNPKATEIGEEFELPLAYDEEADAASWEAMRTFLAEAFGDAE